MKKISLDTHVLYWFLEDSDKLSPAARGALEQNPKLVISVIVLFELLYMERKSGGAVSVSKLLGRLKSFDCELVAVDESIFERARRIRKELDLHDRIIVATALSAGAPLITKDAQVIESEAVKTIW